MNDGVCDTWVRGAATSCAGEARSFRGRRPIRGSGGNPPGRLRPANPNDERLRGERHHRGLAELLLLIKTTADRYEVVEAWIALRPLQGAKGASRRGSER